MFGTRQKDDVTAAATVLKKLEKLYEKEVADTKIDFAFTGVLGEPISLAAQAGGKNPAGIDAALEKAKEVLAAQVTK